MEAWALDMIMNGTGEERAIYRDKFEIGRAVHKYWDDGVFTLGIEYGILLTIKKIFGDLD